MRKKVLKIYGWTLFVGAIYAIWVLLTGEYIECFYWKTTGFKCPGCGLTRMFLSLFKFDIVSAFRYNPVMFIVIIMWNIVGVLCLSDKCKSVQKPRFLYGLLIVTIVVCVAYAILRNIL